MISGYYAARLSGNWLYLKGASKWNQNKNKVKDAKFILCSSGHFLTRENSQQYLHQADVAIQKKIQMNSLFVGTYLDIILKFLWTGIISL
jgi:hypothetical protein